jgi:hypothetical protein
VTVGTVTVTDVTGVATVTGVVGIAGGCGTEDATPPTASVAGPVAVEAAVEVAGEVAGEAAGVSFADPDGARSEGESAVGALRRSLGLEPAEREWVKAALRPSRRRAAVDPRSVVGAEARDCAAGCGA